MCKFVRASIPQPNPPFSNPFPHFSVHNSSIDLAHSAEKSPSFGHGWGEGPFAQIPLMPLSKAISPISSPPYIPPLHSTTDIFYSLFFVGNFIRKMRHFWCRRFALFLNLAILFALSFFFLLLNFNKQFTVKFDQLDKRKEGLSSFEYKLNDNRGREVSISELILPKGSASLQERITLNPIPESQSILLMWDLDFSDLNLRGCPEWNCKITRNHSLFGQARAIFFGSSNYAIERRPNQYFVHYSQESPVNMPSGIVDHFFNMSFGFRMGGNWAASPYGFAAKLAPESRPGPKYLDELLDGIVGKKNKPIAWFVSHCSTQSGREWIAKEMQKHIQVDIYGGCGPMECHRGSNCKEMLNTDYFFYFAAENSICRDYLTEKIWDQGLDTFSVPIVLRRSIAEHLLPPGSFIAVDDFTTIRKLTEHLHKLMQNPLEYMQYFEWRLEYVAIKLNGDTDPRAEKLFGICQVCRLTQMKPMPSIKLPAPMKKWWDESCEKQGKLVGQFKNIKRKTN